MTSELKTFVVNACAFVVVGLPWALQLVPMNTTYSMRLAPRFYDAPGKWCEIHRVLGRSMVVYGCINLCVACSLWWSPRVAELVGRYYWACLGLMYPLIVVPISKCETRLENE